MNSHSVWFFMLLMMMSTMYAWPDDVPATGSLAIILRCGYVSPRGELHAGTSCNGDGLRFRAMNWQFLFQHQLTEDDS